MAKKLFCRWLSGEGRAPSNFGRLDVENVSSPAVHQELVDLALSSGLMAEKSSLSRIPSLEKTPEGTLLQGRMWLPSMSSDLGSWIDTTHPHQWFTCTTRSNLRLFFPKFLEIRVTATILLLWEGIEHELLHRQEALRWRKAKEIVTSLTDCWGANLR